MAPVEIVTLCFNMPIAFSAGPCWIVYVTTRKGKNQADYALWPLKYRTHQELPWQPAPIDRLAPQNPIGGSFI